jgi:hypothetical protein
VARRIVRTREFLERIGQTFRLYDLRYTWATRAAEAEWTSDSRSALTREGSSQRLFIQARWDVPSEGDPFYLAGQNLANVVVPMFRRDIYGATSSILVAPCVSLLQSRDSFLVVPQASVGMRVPHGHSRRDSPCDRDRSTGVPDCHGPDLHAAPADCYRSKVGLPKALEVKSMRLPQELTRSTNLFFVPYCPPQQVDRSGTAMSQVLRKGSHQRST